MEPREVKNEPGKAGRGEGGVSNSVSKQNADYTGDSTAHPPLNTVIHKLAMQCNWMTATFSWSIAMLLSRISMFILGILSIFNKYLTAL